MMTIEVINPPPKRSDAARSVIPPVIGKVQGLTVCEQCGAAVILGKEQMHEDYHETVIEAIREHVEQAVEILQRQTAEAITQSIQEHSEDEKYPVNYVDNEDFVTQSFPTKGKWARKRQA